MTDASPARSVIRGIVRLALFRREGFAEFSATPQGFFNSLSPLIAFGLIGIVQSLANAGWRAAFTNALVAVITMLAPTLIIHALAVRWGRQEWWLTYAVAFNWTQIVFPLLLLAAGFISVIGRVLGFGATGLLTAALFVLLPYALGLHWFITRQSLGLSRGRTLLCMIAVYFGMVVVLFVPLLLAAMLS